MVRAQGDMPAMKRAWSVLVLALTAVAVPAGARERVVHLKVGPFRIEAHRDREVCQAVRIPHARGLDVVTYETRSRTARDVGTHHFIAYGYQGGDSAGFPRTLVDDPGCNGFGPADFFRNRVFLAGSGGEYVHGRWAITSGGVPPGLAQPLPTPADAQDDAVVVLNSHYFNNSRKAAHGLVKLILRLAPADASKRALHMLLEGTASRYIMVPPGDTRTVTATWQADGAPNEIAESGFNPAGDVCVLYLTGHMHKRGTLFALDYEEDGKDPQPLLRATDYVHPGVVYYGRGFLLRAYSAANGHPRFRYSCTHANGSAYQPVKMGCEAQPGVVPGISWAEGEALDVSPLETHARPCGLDGVNCAGYGTGRCVEANLVFGPLSDDDMCILPGAIYDPLPGVPPEQACNPYS